MRLELRHLQVVCSIADHGSLTKAASALGLAPSALTTQLQRIERSLGGLLFERDRYGARPTPLGDLVLSRARALLPAVKDLHDEAARLTGTGGSAQFCRIGAVSSPILGGIICRLNAADPSVQVVVHQSSSPAELADQLVARRVDVALIGLCGRARPPREHQVAWHDIAVDAVCVLLPAHHPRAGRAAVELSEFADAAWAAGGLNECCFEECFAAACARAGFTMRRMYDVDARTATELVEAGEAIGLCQSSFRPPDGLVAVPTAGTPLQWRHVIGWVAGAVAVDVTDRLLEFALGAYDDALARAHAE
ncbi:MAG TPA: LysR family transcriptional regulator [Jiangellales bacterium]|nr:LysR family transcriptional regulator [Jiangellales bacterium]